MSMKYLDFTGLTELVTKIKALVPTKTSDLVNDNFYVNRKVWTVSLPTSGWVGSTAPYTQSINISGMLPKYCPSANLMLSNTISTAITEQSEYNKVSRIDSQNGSVLFTCFEEKPEVDLTVRIEILSD